MLHLCIKIDKIYLNRKGKQNPGDLCLKFNKLGLVAASASAVFCSCGRDLIPNLADRGHYWRWSAASNSNSSRLHLMQIPQLSLQLPVLVTLTLQQLYDSLMDKHNTSKQITNSRSTLMMLRRLAIRPRFLLI